MEAGLNILRAVCAKSLRPTGGKVMLAPNTNVEPQVPLYSKRRQYPKRPELANPTVEEEEKLLEELLRGQTMEVNID